MIPVVVSIARTRTVVPELLERIHGGNVHQCGGSLITVRNVISAGHCFHEIGYTFEKYGVRLGVHDLNDPCHPVINYLHISRRSDYYSDGHTIIHDIAMVTLPISVDFDPIIRPVCLPSLGLDVTDQPVIIAGWGDEKWEGVTPSKPKELHTKVIKHDECSLPPINSTKLCTQSWEQTVCSGDSGGPVVWKDPRTNWYTLVGIVSTTDYCVGHGPATHTRVAAYLPWILDHITGLPSCLVV
ncbi:hypothetical protein GE061_010080 [Apolygus lucorum]|uniref:Peptidase S1 domain-containing protein n=1 Tax=Apolygus lucorum TaxID=248454 RepID=A0A8S9Y436_APOLU|nr:hypothetical protein GE061_010080 [Apolygus lucorum]